MSGARNAESTAKKEIKITKPHLDWLVGRVLAFDVVCKGKVGFTGFFSEYSKALHRLLQAVTKLKVQCDHEIKNATSEDELLQTRRKTFYGVARLLENEFAERLKKSPDSFTEMHRYPDKYFYHLIIGSTLSAIYQNYSEVTAELYSRQRPAIPRPTELSTYFPEKFEYGLGISPQEGSEAVKIELARAAAEEVNELHRRLEAAEERKQKADGASQSCAADLALRMMHELQSKAGRITANLQDPTKSQEWKHSKENKKMDLEGLIATLSTYTHSQENLNLDDLSDLIAHAKNNTDLVTSGGWAKTFGMSSTILNILKKYEAIINSEVKKIGREMKLP